MRFILPDRRDREAESRGETLLRQTQPQTKSTHVLDGFRTDPPARRQQLFRSEDRSSISVCLSLPCDLVIRRRVDTAPIDLRQIQLTAGMPTRTHCSLLYWLFSG